MFWWDRFRFRRHRVHVLGRLVSPFGETNSMLWPNCFRVLVAPVSCFGDTFHVSAKTIVCFSEPGFMFWRNRFRVSAKPISCLAKLVCVSAILGSCWRNRFRGETNSMFWETGFVFGDANFMFRRNCFVFRRDQFHICRCFGETGSMFLRYWFRVSAKPVSCFAGFVFLQTDFMFGKTGFAFGETGFMWRNRFRGETGVMF